MDSKIFISGATGTLGSAIIDQLSLKTTQFRAGVRDMKKILIKGWQNVDYVHFDYRSPNTFEVAFKGVDIFVIIAPSGDPKADETILPSIKFAIDHGVKYFVLISVMGAEMNESLALRKVERYLMDSGIYYTIFRPNWFMQNFLTFMKEDLEIRNGIFIPAGDAHVSFIDVRDIAAIVVKAVTNEELRNRSFTLTGTESLSFYEITELFSKILQKDIQYHPISEEDARKNMLILTSWPISSIEFMLRLYRNIRNGYASAISSDASTILHGKLHSFIDFIQDFRCEWKPSKIPECETPPMHIPLQEV